MNKNVAVLFKHNGVELGTFEEVFEDVDDYNTVDCLNECIYYGCFFDLSKWNEWNIDNIEDFDFFLEGNRLADDTKLKDINGIITCVIR